MRGADAAGDKDEFNIPGVGIAKVVSTVGTSALVWEVLGSDGYVIRTGLVPEGVGGA